jgi:hypothetical protein
MERSLFHLGMTLVDRMKWIVRIEPIEGIRRMAGLDVEAKTPVLTVYKRTHPSGLTSQAVLPREPCDALVRSFPD